MTISIAIRDTEKKIVEVLNNSGLPIDVIDMMVAKLSATIHAQAEDNYIKDLEAEAESAEEEK